MLLTTVLLTFFATLTRSEFPLSWPRAVKSKKLTELDGSCVLGLFVAVAVAKTLFVHLVLLFLAGWICAALPRNGLGRLA